MLTLRRCRCSPARSLRNAVYPSPTWRKAQLLPARRDPDPGPTHRGGGTARHGPPPPAFTMRPPYAPSGSRPCSIGRWDVPPGSAHPAGAVAPAPGWWRRPTDLRPPFETLETASRSAQDQGAGHLPRPGAFQPVSGGQGQRPALDLPDVAGPRALGRTPLGLAGAHGAGAFDP